MRDHPACQVRYLWLPKASAARPAVAIDVFGSLQAWLFVWQARGETTHVRRGSMVLARIYACSLADSAIYAELTTVERVTTTLTLLHYRPLFELQFINQFGLSSIDWLITRLDLIDSLVISQSINQVKSWLCTPLLKTWFTAMPPALRKIGARNSKAFRGTLVQPSTCFADNICRTSAPLQQRRNFLPNPFDSGLQSVSASLTIQHPITVIYNVISTVSSYSAFVP